MQTIKELIIKRLREELSAEEERRFRQWIEQSEQNRSVFEEINDPDKLAESFAKLDSLHTEQVWERVKSYAENNKTQQVFAENNQQEGAQESRETSKRIIPAHRVRFLKTTWFKYAAAVLLIIAGAATYFFIHTSQSNKEMVLTTPSPKTEDVLPGSDRAVLTLSSGQQVQLNSAASETIKDGTLSIENNDGQLIYKNEGVAAMNTMTTPKGGQYKLTLADGTKVWLNAASSITYPAAFTGKTREVTIGGEAYFEVKPNKEKPFIVRTETHSITVVGTEFNVNAYPDEPAMKTSLVEGLIKIGPAFAKATADRDTFVKPGQAYKNGKVNKTDISQDIAWKNGKFNFQDQSTEQILRQIGRWYDLEIVYEKKAPEIRFFGSVNRNVPLSTVLEVLEMSKIRFTLKGKKLIVH